MQRFACCLFVLILPISALLPRTAFAQEASAVTATCNFNEEKQLVVEYQPVTISPKRPLSSQVPSGKPWAPGGKPMTLFTNTPIQIGPRMLPVGAYTMFLVPSSKQWALIVSKSTDMSGAYKEQDDLVRIAMDSGELPNPETSLNASFGHVAPDQCNFRVDLDKYGHFAVFKEQ